MTFDADAFDPAAFDTGRVTTVTLHGHVTDIDIRTEDGETVVTARVLPD